jgi:hypothetical protein
MYKDLAQISRAKDIYRTLDLLAILSPRKAGFRTIKNTPGERSHTTKELVDISVAGTEK